MRYYTNSTAILLNADLTQHTVVIDPPYLFSQSAEYTSSDGSWSTLFDFFDGNEDPDDFSKVKVF